MNSCNQQVVEDPSTRKGMEFAMYPCYKDSRVEWLGKIPNGWKVKRLKFISSIKTGEKDTIHRVENGAYPFFIRSPHVQKIDSYSCNGEAVLTAGDGDIGKIFHYINGKFDYHQRVYKFSNFKEIVGKYLYYYLHYNLAEEVVKLSAKTTVDSLRLPFLQNFSVTIPPIHDQLAIAAFLDQKTAQIDQAVAIKEKQIALLKERKQILIQNAVTHGLDPNIPMRDSGVEWIGEIPKHWETLKLKFLFAEINVRTETGTEVLFSLRMEQGLVPHNDVSDKHISEVNLIDYKIVCPGQMVMNRMRAAIGIFGLATGYGLVSPDYAVFNISRRACPEYFLRLFKMQLLGTQFRLNSKGLGTGSSGFMRLYTENFGDIKVALPPRDEQTAIHTYIEAESAKIDKAVDLQWQQIEKLKEYKATLINSAVTGKIRVVDEDVKMESVQ